jgi:hypothetical protein
MKSYFVNKRALTWAMDCWRRYVRAARLFDVDTRSARATCRSGTAEVQQAVATAITATTEPQQSRHE